MPSPVFHHACLFFIIIRLKPYRYKHNFPHEPFVQFPVESAFLNAKPCHVRLEQPNHLLHSKIIAIYCLFQCFKGNVLSLNLFSMTHSLHQPPECFYRIIPPFADSAFCQTEDSPNLPVRPSDEVIHQHNL